jgi:hypothetical protein
MVLREDPDKGRWVVDVEFGAPVEADEEVEQAVLCANPEDPEDEIVETNLRFVSRKILEGETRKGPVLPKVVCHREIAPEEAMQYFSQAGKTVILDDFVSKRGRPFRGALVRKVTGKHGFEFPPREPKPKAGGGKEPATKKAAAKTAAVKPAAKAAPKKRTPAKKPGTKKPAARKGTAKKKASEDAAAGDAA